MNGAYTFLSRYCARCGNEKPRALFVYCSLRCERLAEKEWLAKGPGHYVDATR